MVAVLGALVVKRVHPVGRRREEEETNVRRVVGVVEELSS